MLTRNLASYFLSGISSWYLASCIIKKELFPVYLCLRDLSRFIDISYQPMNSTLSHMYITDELCMNRVAPIRLA